MNYFFRDINYGSINNYLVDVCSVQIRGNGEKKAADKTAARSFMREKTKLSRFSVILEGLTKLVSFASKRKNLIDLFK